MQSSFQREWTSVDWMDVFTTFYRFFSAPIVYKSHNAKDRKEIILHYIHHHRSICLHDEFSSVYQMKQSINILL
jgi:hypothetical protein